MIEYRRKGKKSSLSPPQGSAPSILSYVLQINYVSPTVELMQYCTFVSCFVSFSEYTVPYYWDVNNPLISP